MHALLLKFAALIAISLTLVIGILRARPYDDGGLREFLFASPGCEEFFDVPCFMGIRPGITTFDEAVALLEAHQWVESVIAQRPVIQWTWSGQQPDFIGFPQERGLATTSRGTIRRLYVGYTSINISDLWLTLDRPTSFNVTTSRAYVDFGASYRDRNLLTQMIVSCPLRVADFWLLKVNVAYEDNVRQSAVDFRFGDMCADTRFVWIG